MKTTILISAFLVSVSAFTTGPTFVARRVPGASTTSYALGNRLRNLVGRGNEDVAVLEREDEAVDQKTELSVESSVVEVSPPAASAVVEDEEEMGETQKLMQQVKDAGLAGVISYALWELGFWAVSVPVCVFGYYELTGHLPDLQNQEDMQKLGAEAFAFVNFARFAVPLRIGLALGTTPWIQENIVDRFAKEEEEEEMITKADGSE